MLMLELNDKWCLQQLLSSAVVLSCGAYSDTVQLCFLTPHPRLANQLSICSTTSICSSAADLNLKDYHMKAIAMT